MNCLSCNLFYKLIKLVLCNKISMFILLLISFVFFVSSELSASPSVLSIYQHSNTLKIAGSDFGLKPVAKPINFDNFAEGVDGDSIGKHSTYWLDPTSADNKMFYSSDYIRVPSHKSAKAVSTANLGNTGQILKNNVGFATTGKIYLNFWVRYDWGTSVGNYWQLKSFSICNSLSDNGDIIYPQLALFNFNYYNSNSFGYIANSYFGTGSNAQLALVDNAKNNYNIIKKAGWYNIVLQADMGTPATANGSYKVWVSDVDFSKPYGENFRGNTMILGDSNNSLKMDAIKIWLYHAPAPTVPGTAVHYFDSIYIDNTWSRVELCDTNTWATRTHCEIQPPTVWSDTSITVTFNQGSFATGDKVYLYVVDSNGVVSNPKEYTIAPPLASPSASGAPH